MVQTQPVRRSINNSNPKKFLSSSILIEAAILIIFWLVSIIISITVFNRPLSSAFHEWLTASTLTGMRSFETYGFFPLVGQLNRLPYSFEFYDLVPKDLPGWKPNHPSLFLVAPYILYKLINFLGLQKEPTISFIQIYQLIFTRLIGTVLIYLICKQVLSRIQSNVLTNKILAFIGTFFWLFAPPVLYWTQNVYHEDQAHLTSSLFLIYLTLLYKFSFRVRSKPEAVLHLITGFWVCSSSYYGYILIPAIALLCIIKNLDSTAARQKFLYLKDKLLTLRYIFAGMAIAFIVYVGQLSYLGYLSKPIERFLERASERGWDSVQKITLVDFVKSVWYNLSYYLPIGSNNFTDGFVGLLSVLVVLTLSVYFVTKISINKKELILSLGLITIPAIAYVTLLMNYTYVHHFSNFKLALPLIFFIVVLPLTVMAYYFNNLLSQKLKYPLILCTVVFSIIFLSKSVFPRFVAFAGVTDKSPQEFGRLVVNNIAEDELPVSDSLPVGISYQPYWQWYAKRLVYKTQRERFNLPFQPEKEHDSLAEFRGWMAKGNVNLHNVRSMKPVYIEYTDKTNSSSFNKICQGYWNQVKETVIGRNISICRSPKLKEALFGKDLN